MGDAGSGPELRHRLLTPPGRGGLTAFALAGPGLADRLARLFRTAPRRDRPSVRWIVDASGEGIDEAMWIPLGEAEGIVTIHGGPVIAAAVSERLRELGAVEELGSIERWAPPGDRLTAEALSLLPAAPTLAAARFLLAQGERLAGWASRAAADPRAIPEPEIRAALARWRAAAAFGRSPRIVLAGVPNSGKSTLFNRLIGRERVVVDPAPGTTRDRIEERGVVADRPVLWVDGAGIREGGDEIEREGIRRMLDTVQGADLAVLLVPPGGEVPDLPERPGRPLLRILSHADSISPPAGSIAVSGRTGAGVDELCEAVAELLFGGAGLPREPTPFTARQRDALAEALRRRAGGGDERAVWRAFVSGGEEGGWGRSAT